MKVTQIAELINKIVPEEVGQVAVENEDLTGLVEMGNSIESVYGYDNFVRSLVDQVGKIIFVDRLYRPSAPSVIMDNWEFGSILEKITPDKLLAATENESWELEDGVVYEENMFTKISISAKFYNNKTSFEIPISIAQLQVKSAFQNAVQMNSFISMIYSVVNNSMTVQLDALIRRTVNNFIGETIQSDEAVKSSISNASGTRAINLLKLYNDETSGELTAETAIHNPEFIRFAVTKMLDIMEYLADMSTKYNAGGKPRFTPRDRLKVIMLSHFKNAANTYLQSDTFHNIYTALPDSETVTYWQGQGNNGDDFKERSKIDITTASGHVEVTGVLAVMFDRDALGVSLFNRRTTSKWNAKAEFWNEWHKCDARYFNDMNENGVVFYVA